MTEKVLKNIRHREFVGFYKNWDEIGNLQLYFLQKMGLKPFHKLLDVGCGSLRGGRKFIEYLNKGNYYGMDHHKWLVDAGLKYEVKDKKGAHFTINDEFDFSEFGNTKFDFIWLSSLIIHLTPARIKQCLNNLEKHIKKNGVLYLSIIIGDSRNNLSISSERRCFRYEIDEFKQFINGWDIEHSDEIHKIYKSAASWRKRGRKTIFKLTLKK